MDKTFQLEVSTYEKKCFDAKVKDVIIPAYKGLWGIKRGHSNTICLLNPGIVKIKDENDNPLYFMVGEGVCEITPQKVTLLVRSFAKKQDIDQTHLKQSMEKISEKLKNIEKYTQKEQLKITYALLRAQARKKLLS